MVFLTETQKGARAKKLLGELHFLNFAEGTAEANPVFSGAPPLDGAKRTGKQLEEGGRFLLSLLHAQKSKLHLSGFA